MKSFAACLASEIGDIDFPARTVELYTADLISGVDLSAAREAQMKMVLDLSYGSASFVMPNVLSKLGADVLVVNPYAHTPGHDLGRPGHGRGPRGLVGPGLGGSDRRRGRCRGRAPHHHRRRRHHLDATTKPF